MTHVLWCHPLIHTHTPPQTPGYQVLWSDVDCTADTYLSLGQRRAAQPLFYGTEPAGGGTTSAAQVASGPHAAAAAHAAAHHEAHRREHAVKVAAGEADAEDDDEDDEDGVASDEEQGDEVWDAAGGAPLVAQVRTVCVCMRVRVCVRDHMCVLEIT